MGKMIQKTPAETNKTSVEYFRKQYKRHFQSALVQAGASLIMWLFVFVAFIFDIISQHHFVGVSIAVIYLIGINPPTLWVLKRIQDRDRLISFSIFINFLEIMGYTAVIYFMGGIEATYLTILYAAVIAYVGSVSRRRHTFLITGICIAAYNVMILLEGTGLIPWHKVISDFHLPWSHRLARMFVVDGLLLVVTYITSYTALLLRKTKDDLLAAYDVLEQRVAEKTKEYRLLVENQTDMIIKVDFEGRFLFVSPSCCRVFGKKEDELLGQNFLSLVHKEDQERTARKMKKLFQAPFSVYMEQRVLTKDGWKWLGWMNTAILDDNGNVKEVIGVGRDITERKQKEEALRKSERRYRLIADNVSDVIWTMGMDQRFTYASPSIVKLLGYTPREALQTSLKNILTPESYEKGVQVITKAIVREKEYRTLSDVTLNLELEHVRKDGDKIYVELTTSFVRNEEGLLSGFIGVSRDITKKKRVEEQRDKSILDLKKALVEVKKLSGLLPICSYCKKIRDDKGYWNQIESYIHEHSEAEFSHSICQECAKKHYPDIDIYDD
jgi:PAS domain S-box-containing protein